MLHAQAEPPLTLSDAKAVTYTRTFAERFALARLEPSDEPTKDVQAISFSIERLPDDNLFYYQCLLKVYFDSDLAVDYPTEGRSSSRWLSSQREHFVFDGNLENHRWLSLSESDRIHFSRLDNFRMLVFLSSPDLGAPASRYSTNAVVDGFHKDLFPGISYVKLDVDCAWIGRNVTRGLQLWFKRVGAKDYRRFVHTDPQDFLKFDLPKTFHDRISSMAKIAGDYNSVTFWKRYKPKRGAK